MSVSIVFLQRPHLEFYVVLSGAILIVAIYIFNRFCMFLLLGKSIDYLCVVTEFSYHILAMWHFLLVKNLSDTETKFT